MDVGLGRFGWGGRSVAEGCAAHCAISVVNTVMIGAERALANRHTEFIDVFIRLHCSFTVVFSRFFLIKTAAASLAVVSVHRIQQRTRRTGLLRRIIPGEAQTTINAVFRVNWVESIAEPALLHILATIQRATSPTSRLRSSAVIIHSVLRDSQPAEGVVGLLSLVIMATSVVVDACWSADVLVLEVVVDGESQRQGSGLRGRGGGRCVECVLEEVEDIL